MTFRTPWPLPLARRLGRLFQTKEEGLMMATLLHDLGFFGAFASFSARFRADCSAVRLDRRCESPPKHPSTCRQFETHMCATCVRRWAVETCRFRSSDRFEVLLAQDEHTKSWTKDQDLGWADATPEM